MPDWARKTAALFAFILVLLVPAWAGTGLQGRTRSSTCWWLFIGLLLLGKPLYALFWRGLESVLASTTQSGAGVANRAGSKRLPLAAAIGLALLIVWGRGTQPSPTLLILLAIILALYVVPPRVRQYVIP